MGCVLQFLPTGRPRTEHQYRELCAQRLLPNLVLHRSIHRFVSVLGVLCPNFRISFRDTEERRLV